MVALFAIGAAFLYALGHIITRIGIGNSNALSGTFITAVFALTASVIGSLFFVPIALYSSPGVLYFIMAGFLGPFLARYFLFIGIGRVGASITIPISQTSVLVSAITALVLLGEGLTFPIALGTLLIIVGAITVSLEESGGQIEREWSKKDLIFPVLSSVFYGLSHIARKMGLALTPEPLMGVAIQNATTLVFLPLIAQFLRKRQRLILNDKMTWFTFSMVGLVIVIGQFFVFLSLQRGQVIVAAPLFTLQPFFVLIFAALFLRRLEKVTWRIVMGSALIVGGSVVLTALS